MNKAATKSQKQVIKKIRQLEEQIVLEALISTAFGSGAECIGCTKKEINEKRLAFIQSVPEMKKKAERILGAVSDLAEKLAHGLGFDVDVTIEQMFPGSEK